jgi:hypothetical protein
MGMFRHAVTTDELTAARAVVLAADPSETDITQGVALVRTEAETSWLAWGPHVMASSTPVGDAPDDNEIVVVSRRLVEFAAALGEQREDVVLDFGDDGTTVTNGSVAVTFGAPAIGWVPLPVRPFEGPAARAWMPARELFQLFAMGRVLPVGVDLDGVDAPAFHVAITDGRVAGSVDWRHAGAPATRFDLGATTNGVGVADVSPVIAAHVVGFTDPDEVVTLTIPAGAQWVEVETAAWTARIRATPPGDDGQHELPFVDTIHVEGGLRDDPIAGASLTDVRAFAMDPDLQTRLHAAASRWNWDLRVQLALAADEHERVVLTLLDAVDPYREVVDVIIDGSHVAARRVLAGRNLLTELLERLADDPDPVTAETARRTLAARCARTPTCEATR